MKSLHAPPEIADGVIGVGAVVLAHELAPRAAGLTSPNTPLSQPLSSTFLPHSRGGESHPVLSR